ncbi:MAG TPA: histidinol-phosphatase [Marinospirillum sp.]|uniref:histidinol-phosphatase n=1 Tax=Marinospirillum sp. TaxID=2183934 RepID=UPI002B48190E|nr:histidinol-phosphatase [Marinospirillum sp.]HKM15629.1 histidinol-phosphatase [Marinospirillum sp.]
MIDSHLHTFYSKHAVGSVDEVVQSAIAKGIKIITITDHGPFYIDNNNRLLDNEMDQYFLDIEQAKNNYVGEIKILAGLELDYVPGSYGFNKNLISRYDLDFVIGSIHYISMPNENSVKVWDLEQLGNIYALDSYFNILIELIECGIFDAVGHVDSLLRAVPEYIFLEYITPILPLFNTYNISYELNTSGLRKSMLNLKNNEKKYNCWSYPSKILIPKLLAHDINFTIGSDAHDPVDVGAGIQEVVHTLKKSGLREISYFEKRQRIGVSVDFFN